MGFWANVLSGLTLGAWKPPFTQEEIRRFADQKAMARGFKNTADYEQFLKARGEKLPKDWFIFAR